MPELTDAEIAERLAERVMGWKQEYLGRYWKQAPGEFPLTLPDSQLVSAWSPCTNIEQAMMVAMKLLENAHDHFELSITRGDLCSAVFTDTGQIDTAIWYADRTNPARAICLAALATLEEKP